MCALYAVKYGNSMYQVFLSNMNNFHIAVGFQITNNNNPL